MAKAKKDSKLKDEAPVKSSNPLKTVRAKISKPAKKTDSPNKNVKPVVKATETSSKNDTKSASIKTKGQKSPSKVSKKLVGRSVKETVKISLSSANKKGKNDKSVKKTVAKKSQSNIEPKTPPKESKVKKKNENTDTTKGSSQALQKPMKYPCVKIEAIVLSDDSKMSANMPSMKASPNAKVQSSPKSASKKIMSKTVAVKESGDKKSKVESPEKTSSKHKSPVTKKNFTKSIDSKLDIIEKSVPRQDKQSKTDSPGKKTKTESVDEKTTILGAAKQSTSPNTDNMPTDLSTAKRSISPSKAKASPVKSETGMTTPQKQSQESKHAVVRVFDSKVLSTPTRATPSPSKMFNTPGKKPKKVKVKNIRDQDDIKIIKQVTPVKARKNVNKKVGGKKRVLDGAKSPVSKSHTDKFDSEDSTVNASDEKLKTLNTSQIQSAKKDIGKKKVKPKSTVTRLRTPKTSGTDMYKNHHSIGRRSAGRVCSYKETEIALLFPDDYKWSVVKQTSSGGCKNTIESNKTASDYETDSDKEISFAIAKNQDIVNSESPKVVLEKRMDSHSPKRPSNKDYATPKVTKPTKRAPKRKVDESAWESSSESEAEEIQKSPKKSAKNKSKTSPKVLQKRRKSKYEDILPRAPRIQRTACLNANAINRALYDTSARKQPTKTREDMVPLKCERDSVEKEEKSQEIKKPTVRLAKRKAEEEDPSAKPKKKKAVKRKKREVDISVWAPPKRMASLNAQAIMTAYKELDEMKLEKPPKQRKENKPKSRKPVATVASPPISATHETAKAPVIKENMAHSVRKAYETHDVRFVAMATQISPTLRNTTEAVHSPNEYINVVDDADVTSGHSQSVNLSLSSSNTSANTSGRSSDIQIIDTSPQGQIQSQEQLPNFRGQLQNFRQELNDPVGPKVSTRKPMAQYSAMPYQAKPQAPFTHGTGFEPTYQPQSLATSHPGPVRQGGYLSTGHQFGAPSAHFDPRLMYPRHSNQYKQHPSVQNVPPYPPTSYNLTKSPFENTSRSPFESPSKSPYDNVVKSQYDTPQTRFSVTSVGTSASNTTVYTQAQTVASMDTLSGGERAAPLGFQSVRPAMVSSSPYTQTTAAVSQSGSYGQPFMQGSVGVQNYPTGFSVMGYPRHPFGQQGPFMNSGYQMFAGQSRHTGNLSSGQAAQQNIGNQTGQGQAQNVFLNYGYLQPAGPLLHAVGASPYMAMPLPHTNVKPFTPTMMAHTQPVFQPDNKSSNKPLAIAPKPFTDTEKRTGKSTKSSPSKSTPKTDAIDLTKDHRPVFRPTYPVVVVTSDVQLSTQILPQYSSATISPSTSSKPTKDIMDLDSKKVKVHRGAVGEMERHSPLKIPRGMKSTSTGAPPAKKLKVDSNASKTSTKSTKVDKTQAANVTAPPLSTGVATPGIAPTIPPTVASFGVAGQPRSVHPFTSQTRQPFVGIPPVVTSSGVTENPQPMASFVGMPVINVPGGINPLVAMPFQARHVLPGQVTMPRGPYGTRPLAVARNPNAFKIQNLSNTSAPKPAPIQRKRPSQSEKLSKTKTDFVKQSAEIPTHKVKSTAIPGMTESIKPQLLPKTGRGNKSEQTTFQLDPLHVMTQQNKGKCGKALSPSENAKQDEKKVLKKETPNKTSQKSADRPDISRQKSESQTKQTKPNSPRQKTDPHKLKLDTTKSKGEANRKTDSPRQRPDTPKQKLELKYKKEDSKGSPSSSRSLLASLKSQTSSGGKKDRKRIVEDRKLSPGGTGRKRIQSAPPTPPTSWQWEGQPELKNNHLPGEMLPVLRKCYPGIRHSDGDVIRVRDCVLVKSGTRKKDIPFVAKIATLWDCNGEMMMNIFWYYRPEQTDTDRLPKTEDNEIFASRHRDVVPVACIDDKAYVLTFNEFCRFKTEQKRIKEGLSRRAGVVPTAEDEHGPMPPMDAPPETVFLCRKVYDVKLKRFLKNPQVNNCHSPMSSKAHSVASKSPSPKAPTPTDSMDSTSSPYHNRTSGSDQRGRPLQFGGTVRDGSLASPTSPDNEVFVLHSANLPSFVPKGHVSVLKHDTAVAPLNIVLPSDSFLERQTSVESSSKTDTSESVKFDKVDKPLADQIGLPNTNTESIVHVSQSTEANQDISTRGGDAGKSEATKLNMDTEQSTDSKVTRFPLGAATVSPNSPIRGANQTETYKFVAKDVPSAKSNNIPSQPQPPTTISHSAGAPFETYKFVARHNSTTGSIPNRGSDLTVVAEQKLKTPSEKTSVENVNIVSTLTVGSISSGIAKIPPKSATENSTESNTNVSDLVTSAEISTPENTLSTGTETLASSAVNPKPCDNDQKTDIASCSQTLKSKQLSQEDESLDTEVHSKLSATEESKTTTVDLKQSTTENVESNPDTQNKQNFELTSYKDITTNLDSNKTVVTSPTKTKRHEIDLNVSLDSDKTIDASNVSMFEALNTSSSTDDSECREGEQLEIITDMTIVEDGAEKNGILPAISASKAKGLPMVTDQGHGSFKQDFSSKITDKVAAVTEHGEHHEATSGVAANMHSSNLKTAKTEINPPKSLHDDSDQTGAKCDGQFEPPETCSREKEANLEETKSQVQHTSISSSCNEKNRAPTTEGEQTVDQSKKGDNVSKVIAVSEQMPSPIAHAPAQHSSDLKPAPQSAKIGLSFTKSTPVVLPPFETLRTMAVTRTVSVPNTLDTKPVARSSPVNVDPETLTKMEDMVKSIDAPKELERPKDSAAGKSQNVSVVKETTDIPDMGLQESLVSTTAAQNPNTAMSRIEQIVSQIKKGGGSTPGSEAPSAEDEDK